MNFFSDSAEKTLKIGVDLAKSLHGSEILLLGGDLGAGKTVLTKGIAKGLGIVEPITSPTFTIMNMYEGRLKLYHYDAYRLASADEAICAGLAEFLGEKDAVCVVEWFQNIDNLFRGLKIRTVNITYLSENEREIQIDDE